MHDDHEAMMARAELYKAAKYAMKLFKMIREGDELEGWVSAKITKAADYLDSVAHYMEYHQEVKHEFEALDYKGSLREALDRTLVEAKKKVEMKKKLEKKKAEIDESLNENDDAIKAHEKQGRRVKRHSDGSYTWYDDKDKIARKVKKGGKGGESVKYTPKGKKEDDPDLDESRELVSPPDGATAPPPKGKDGKYPIVTSGPHKGKRWSPQTPGPTNPNFKESKSKPDFLDVDKDGDKKEPMKKALKDKKVKESAKLEVDPKDKDLEVKKNKGKTTVTSKTGRVTTVIDKDKMKVASGK